MDLEEIGLDSVVRIYLTQDGKKWLALVSKVMKLRVLQCAADFLDQLMNYDLLKKTSAPNLPLSKQVRTAKLA